ncbi:His/Glu/Gln/Arg/opine family amino acid ABC transporter permease subunit [Arthrobacter globiformis]|nr:His/Glu/Gln/Arg/opine family amino acid ABC transporter permease subunit [Arthrobacter globiformis]
MDILTQWLGWLPNLAPGLLISLQLTGLALLFGFPLGLLLAVMAAAKFAPLQWISFLVVEIGRGLPALVLLYLLYFSLPDAGITLTSLTTAIIALSWNTGAYASEYFRAGLAAVPLGQKEAALTSGLRGWTGFRIVILPQALRIFHPAPGRPRRPRIPGQRTRLRDRRARTDVQGLRDRLHHLRIPQRLPAHCSDLRIHHPRLPRPRPGVRTAPRPPPPTQLNPPRLYSSRATRPGHPAQKEKP